MRLLFVAQQFRQGWGGAPESVRLMANQLQSQGVVSDVFDDGRLHRDIGKMALLPEAGAAAAPFDFASIREYDAIIVTGPWQKPAAVARLLRSRVRDQRVFYLPRGGLGRAEFRRLRDIKKIPYFFAIERRILNAADSVVFSSRTEQRLTVSWARRPNRECIIPDFVNHVVSALPTDERDQSLTFSFLAEISQRKGLLPLVTAFAEWAKNADVTGRARLVVGGSARPGCERYLDRVKHVAAVANHANIEFRGAVPHAARDRFYAETDVMVVSSSFESYGLTVIESLAQGCLLLSCPDVGALEYIGSNAAVTVATSNNTADISRALKNFTLFTRNTESDRLRNRKACAASIDTINAQAGSAWMDMLRG
jgi:glycosyltransferase involved in cell wall biosynthesis